MVTALLMALIDRGVRFHVWPDGGMRCTAPPGVLSPQAVEAVRRLKPLILAAVHPSGQTVGCVGCGRFAFPLGVAVCHWCRARHRGATDGRTAPELPDDPQVEFPDVGKIRRCRSCGGGLHRDDADGGPCSTCRWWAASLGGRQ